jgi:hypothetical protein
MPAAPLRLTAARVRGPTNMTDHQQDAEASRKGVKRTVKILVVIVLVFFALSFAQILLMK